ncbi:ATP-binding cassette domain-containing protein [Psittacicella gerlachiana]|nr:ATP-binding cassette domain-containing protein [Psittacicella gerlachiana]
MNKAHQKYLMKILDNYCAPMKRYLNIFIFVITLCTIFQVVAITKLVSILITTPEDFFNASIYLGVVLLTMVIKALAIFLRSSLTQKQAAKIRTEVRNQVLKRCENLGAKGLGHNTIDMSIFYLEQVELLNNYIARFYPQAIASRIQPILILIAVFCLNWIAGLILLICFPLLPVFMILIGLKTSEMNAKQLKNLLFLGNQFHDKLVGIKTIIAFSKQKETLEKMTINSQNYTYTTMQLLKVAFLNSAVLEFLSSVCVALMAVYFGIAYLEQFSFGAYAGTGISIFAGFFCLTLAGEFFQPLRDLGTYYHDRSSALNAIDELEKFINQQAQENQDYLDIEQISPVLEEEEKDSLYDSSFKTIDLATNADSSKIYNKRQSKRAKQALAKLTLDASQAPATQNLKYPFQHPSSTFIKLTRNSVIKAEDLCIYTHSGQLLVANLNFSFTLNEKVAIIGESGAGKTSLLSCLLGLYPYTGSLTFDQVELTEINREFFYPYLSWLGQNPNLDQVSILENLSYSSRFLNNNLEQAPVMNQSVALNALEQEYANYLFKLPDLSRLSIQDAINNAQLNSLVAERGLTYTIQQHNMGLSGGQVQRLALARALAKPHLLLIIDEPTANLDHKLEKAIFSNIQNHAQGIIMVTHRLEQSSAFDKVYSLNKNGIYLEKEGKYA